MRPPRDPATGPAGGDGSGPGRPAGPRWGRWLWIAGGALALLLVLLGVAQLVLPGIAAERVRERVAHYGSVHSVAISASPAVELLWGQAERITVGAGALTITPAQLVGLSRSVEGVGRAELSASSLALPLTAPAQGEVTMHAVHAAMRGGALFYSAGIGRSDLHVSLPVGLQVQNLESDGGRPEVEVYGEFLGVRIAAHAVVSAVEGQIVVEPAGVPFASLARLPLFSDRQVYVQSVSVTPQGDGYALTIAARRVG